MVTRGKTQKAIKRGKKKKSRRPAFLRLFDRRTYSKIAREYHHEVHHLIIDLLSINRKISNAEVLCQHQLDIIVKKRGHLLHDDWGEYFEEAVYHLENFAFRSTAFRDKLTQFVNQALFLGYDEKERGMVNKIFKNRISREALIHTEIKKFSQNEDLRSVLSKRISLSHLRYYSESEGYKPYLLPDKERVRLSKGKFIRLWKVNIKQEIEKTDTFTKAAMDIADKVMRKIVNYWEKHPKPNA